MVVREPDNHSTPRLTVFFMRFDLRNLKAGFGEVEWSGQVIQESVSDKVELLKFAPPRHQVMTGKRDTRRGKFLNGGSLGIFDPDSIWSEVPGRIFAVKWRDDDQLSARFNM